MMAAGKLSIAFISSEVVPFAKTGGLADVAAALPDYLFKQGHDVRVFMPLYSSIDRTHLQSIDEFGEIEISLGRYSYTFVIYQTKPGELPVYFIDCAPLYQRPGLYTNDDDEHRRFAFFCQAVIIACQHLRWAPQVFHCNDWQSALIPLYLQTLYAWDRLFEESRTLLSIHNIGYQGTFSAQVLNDLGLAGEAEKLHQEDLRNGVINFLKTGLLYTDKISTVSPTYAQEICTEQYGMGLHFLLQQRRDDLSGILNGVDYSEWNPKSDPYIPFQYSSDDLSGKTKNKKHLLKQLSLLPSDDTPLLGIVSRLASQKGFDLLITVLPEVLQNCDLHLVVLGSGEPEYEAFFTQLQQQYPGVVCFHQGFHNELAHRIEAASDIFLMPSYYEPCGLNQMYSLKYGTIPLVRKTGGLADTVTLFNPQTDEGTGIVFEHYDAQGLRWAIDTALKFYNEHDAWMRMQQNAMAQDFSWSRQGALYEALYEALYRKMPR